MQIINANQSTKGEEKKVVLGRGDWTGSVLVNIIVYYSADLCLNVEYIHSCCIYMIMSSFLLFS